MVQQTFDLESLSKDDDFRSQLESAALKLLKSGTTKGWTLSSISFSEPGDSGGDRSYVSAVSKGKFDGKIAHFYATCIDGTCVVSSVSFVDPEMEKRTVY